jgi:hypothetical protein
LVFSRVSKKQTSLRTAGATVSQIHARQPFKSGQSVSHLTCENPAAGYPETGRVLSSVVEHFLHTEGVGGSNPPARTIFPQEIEVNSVTDTAVTQETAESEGANVKYPKRIKHRGRVLATIYGRSKGRDSYRVAWQVAGQRRMASFASYSLAKRHADGLVKDLSKGSQVTALHPAQARDALAALERLADLYRATGRRVSLLAGISANLSRCPPS